MRSAWGAARSSFAAVSACGPVLYVARGQHVHTAFAQPQPERAAFEKCPEVACKGSDDTSSLFEEPVTRRVRPLSSSKASDGDSGRKNTTTNSLTVSPTNTECPLNREQLGRATWAFLHSTAAYYPDQPSPDDIRAAHGLIQGLAQLYPCTHCRAAFAADLLEHHPPTLGSRQEFSLWLCKAHNRVSASLGRPPSAQFPCTLPSLDERWRTGRADCWGGAPGATASAEQQQTAEESLGQGKEEDE